MIKIKQMYIRWLEKNILELEEQREATNLLNQFSTVEDAITFHPQSKKNFVLFKDREYSINKIVTFHSFKAQDVFKKIIENTQNLKYIVKRKRTKKVNKN